MRRSTDPAGLTGSTFAGQIVRGASDGPDALLYRHIYLDCVRVARIVAALPEVDPRFVSTMGGSQGGGLALACAALEPSVARAASQYPFLCDWLRVWELDLAVAELGEMDGGYVAEFRPEDKVEPRDDQLRRVGERFGLGYSIPERCLGPDVYGIWSVGET